MSHRSSILLNAGNPLKTLPEQPIDIALTLALADLKGRFIDPEKGTVQYKAMRGSQEFACYKDLARGLRSFDLRVLKTSGQKLAFWINIYNALVIHGVIELGLERSVREFPRFFDRMIYDIGGHHFSLNDIEHGILRSNRRLPYRILKPFGKRDLRLEFVISPPDPRIHFALVCGARSCPPISFYEAGQIDFQLDLAATSFINSPRVRIMPEEETVIISKIFRWYRTDFGGSHRAVIDFLLKFLDESKEKILLEEKKDSIRIRYQPYDWNLNQ